MLLLLKWLDWICGAYAGCGESEACKHQMMLILRRQGVPLDRHSAD